MKNTIFSLTMFWFAAFAMGQSSSSKTKFQVNQILGDWKLTNFSYGVRPAKPKSLTTCDSSMIWRFVQDASTKKNVLSCLDTLNACSKDYGFESDWVFSGNSIAIRRTKIMGFGGISASGTFLIKELSKTKMTLEFQKNKYYFTKR